jgi:hypothetical protein
MQATVFVRRFYDNALWNRQTTFSGNPPFTDWATLGGAMNGPARVAGIDDYVMYRGMDNAAWFIRDATPFVTGDTPATWSDQVSLGGYIISNPTMVDRRSPTNDQEVFVVGGDNALWVTVSPVSGSPFGPWQSLGGCIVGDPSAQRNGDNTIDVFVIGCGGALWHIRQSKAGSWQ